MIAQVVTNQQIADVTFLSINAIETYVRSAPGWVRNSMTAGIRSSGIGE